MKIKKEAFLYKSCVFPPKLYSLFTISQALIHSLGKWLMNNPELCDKRLNKI